MPNSKNYVSPKQLAANRANAAKSSGPRSPEGKTRSAQNARKHGFTAEAYTVVRFEDLQDLANLKDDLIDFYQPVNSQELFAVERLALAQQAILRACGLTDIPRAQIDPILLADTEVARVQNRNFILAEGFQHSAAKSNALSLCLRYAAQAERQYRRALDEFDRLKLLRPTPSGADLPVCVLPAPTLDETNPIPPEATQSEGLTPIPSTQPEVLPAAPDAPSGAPAAPVATFPLGKLGPASSICRDGEVIC